MVFIAHRGLKKDAVENTKKAFMAAALSDEYDAIECDIHMTKDGLFVVHHDDTLKRIYNLDVKIKDESFDTLDKMLGGDLISLQEFLTICETHNKKAIIEVKQVFELEDLMTLLDTINLFENLRYAIISFNLTYLKYLRVLSEAELHLLAGELTEPLFEEAKRFNLNLALHYQYVDMYVVHKAHKAGLKVNVWTLKNLDDIEKMQKLEVDYITKD